MSTPPNERARRDIQVLHSLLQDKIAARLADFKRLWAEGSEEDLFAELAFCLLTPQSRARTCWPAVECLVDREILFSGSSDQILEELNGVRFKYRKSTYITAARDLFTREGRISVRPHLSGFENSFQAREWLVKNVKGLGYKEASHFLRNIGIGEELAILDRHILKNLVLLEVIEVVPKSLTKKRYLEIEEKMRKFAEEASIPLGHLDLLLWSKETGEIFK